MNSYTGIELYRGPSMLNGAPIVAIATLHSQNAKTGDMIQTWILHAEESPTDAVKSGADVAICGQCPHRHHTGGACYVIPFHGPSNVYRAWKRGGYPKATRRHLKRLTGRPVRLGSYGDPAAVPTEVWDHLLKGASFSTGYTHQPNADLGHHCMASADTPEQAEALQSVGWRTFRVKRPGDPLAAGEILCPASANSAIQCVDCQVCSGGNEGVNVAIDLHGSRAGKYKLIATAA